MSNRKQSSNARENLPFPAARRDYAEAKRAAKNQEASPSTNTPESASVGHRANMPRKAGLQMNRLQRLCQENCVPSTTTTMGATTTEQVGTPADSAEGHSENQVVVSPLHPSGTDDDQSDNPSAAESASSLSLPPQEMVLLGARIVEELALVHAEPILVNNGVGMNSVAENNSFDTKGRSGTVNHRNWLRPAAIVLLLGGAVLLGTLLRRSQTGSPSTSATIVPSLATANNQPTTSMVPSWSPTNHPTWPPTVTEFVPIYTLHTIDSESNNNNTSAQAKALDWVLAHPQFSTLAVWRKQQLLALSTFYYATDGEASWSRPAKLNWLNVGVHECEWQQAEGWQQAGGTYNSMACGANGEYKLLHRKSLDHVGSIPPEISLLSNLTYLSLQECGLTSSIPTEIGSMTALTSLNMGENRLSGSVPKELGELTAVRGLYLFNNQLGGSLPTQLGLMTSLTSLRAFTNKFVGTVPTQIGKLAGLRTLLIYDNHLTHFLPSQLGQLDALANLGMSWNHFSGHIPSELGMMTSCTELRLHTNQLSGSLSSELGLLTALKYMSIKKNHLTGTIPHEYGLLTRLGTLIVQNNSFTGSLPPGLCNLTGLALDCRYNPGLNCTCPL